MKVNISAVETVPWSMSHHLLGACLSLKAMKSSVHLVDPRVDGGSTTLTRDAFYYFLLALLCSLPPSFLPLSVSLYFSFSPFSFYFFHLVFSSSFLFLLTVTASKAQNLTWFMIPGYISFFLVQH